MTSTRTTSPSSFSTAYWATEAPTLPAPTTVILGRPASNVPSLAYRLATEAGGWITDSPRLRLRLALRPRDVLRLALQLRHVFHDGGGQIRGLYFFCAPRSGEATAETQSPFKLRCRLLLSKK